MATKMTLEELKNQLSGLGEYQKRTEDELRVQAESLYKGQYEQNLKLLQDSINQSVANQQRSVLDRGMQRSSYNQAQQAIIRGRGLDAQAQLGTDYSANVASTLLNMLNTEYDREQAANQYRNELLFALYDYGNKGSGGGTPKKDTDDTTTKDPFSLIDNALLSALSGSSLTNTGVNQNLYGKPFNKLTQTLK